MPKSRYYIIELFKTLISLPSLVAAGTIWLYQRTLSLDHGPLARFFPGGYCRFYPSCSEYSRQSFFRYGFWRGLSKTIWRILRCNPFHSGGVDEP
ncbi:membrane protein insertion efficiency factor YidD [Candidatus Microgenomates bacterium]|nr:membrane protein insertion efficiency factor YidD [Candidatus Microgenomates bacterium]